MQEIIEEEEIYAPDGVEGKRLDRYISEIYETESRARIQKLIKSGFILVNDQIKKPSYKLKPFDKLHIRIPRPEKFILEPEPIYFEILYVDRDVIVLNKPQGLVVHPGSGHSKDTLLNGIVYLFSISDNEVEPFRPGVVHRLDRDTSGVMIIARNSIMREQLISQFKNRLIKKEYLAIVCGKLPERKGRIETYIRRHPHDRKKMIASHFDGKPAITEYEVIEYINNFTFVKLFPLTGRTHQIRVHLSFIGFPVVGDKIYSSRRIPRATLMLHSYYIKFYHPGKETYMEFKTEIPPRFYQFLRYN